MTVLLDSTVLIDALRGRGGLREQLAKMVMEEVTLATSAANLAEVYAGVRQNEQALTDSFLASIVCLPVDEAIGRRAGELKNEWARMGRTLSVMDMMVAATALVYGLPLMTDNPKDFPMAELRFHPE